MKTLIFVLVLLAFLQSTIFPVNLVLITLLLRAYIKVDQTNLYLAFGFGLLVAFLSHTNMGVSSLVYLVLVQLMHLFSKTPLSRNLLLLAPLIFVGLFINDLINALSMGQSISFDPKILIGSLLALPMYFILKIWEERFVATPEVKLKL